MITVDLFESDFSKKPNHTTKTVAEGIQADYLTQVFDQILDGELDAYDVMNHPRGSAQEHVAMVLQDMYDDVARDHRLHPDDNFEEILDIVVDRIEKDYGHSTDKGVAEAGNKPLEKSRFGTGDTRTPRDIKSQMSGASDEFVRSTADKTTGPFHSKVAKMQGKMAKSELRRREQGVAEGQSEPEQQQIDANRRAALRREREPAGSDTIDARLAQQHAQRQEYEKTGKFWIKRKDNQQHISDVIVGKAAANAAALDMLKQQPELRGNIVITAYGPGESQGIAEGNYDRDDYYNARQGREYGKGLAATGWGGDGSATRRDDIFKGQSKRLPADPFARTTGAVPDSGQGRQHRIALPGEMDEANDQKIGGRHDADDFDDMVSRLKKLAGSGPMRTVYDPETRRYKNVPVAPQSGDKK